MSDERNEIVESIEQTVCPLVSAGYMSGEDIAESVLADYDESPSDEIRAFVEGIVERLMAEHFSAQSTWPSITDCDRLDAAFVFLESSGILARQDYWCCTTCAGGAIVDEMDVLAAAGTPARGYTFFHTQGTESAVEGDGLWLAYGKFNEQTAEEGIAIGHEVAQALRDQGLAVEWDGTIEKKIYVPLDWKRRRDPGSPPSAQC